MFTVYLIISTLSLAAVISGWSVAACYFELICDAIACSISPLTSRVLHYNDWFNLTFEVECHNQITHVSLYTSGHRYSIQRYLGEGSEEFVTISVPSPCDTDRNHQNFSISINMTKEVHQPLNGVLTVLGQNPLNPSVICISLPSARYYIQDGTSGTPPCGELN